jgi:hypothetical protein
MVHKVNNDTNFLSGAGFHPSSHIELQIDIYLLIDAPCKTRLPGS